MPKPIFTKKRPLSWSAISSFEYDKEQWYDKYVRGIERPKTKELAFGSYVDKRLQDDPTYLPQVERYPVMQHEMRAVFDTIPLVGYADGYDPNGRRLKDDKTGKKEWDQKRADETGQLTMYMLLLNLTEKVAPYGFDLFINWMPTKENGDFTIGFRDDPMKPVLIHTKRTMRDILDFGAYIHDIHKQMYDFSEAHS